MVEVYVKLVKQSGRGVEPVNQQRALQLLFDIRYLRLMIPRKDDAKVWKIIDYQNLSCLDIKNIHLKMVLV